MLNKLYLLTSLISVTVLFLITPQDNFISNKLVLAQVSENATNSMIFSESASVEEFASFVADRHGGQGKGVLTETPVIGNLTKSYEQYYVPGKEKLDEDEIRVTFIGSGMPFPRKSQASSGVLVELGNNDKLLFDIGSGSIANFNALQIPLKDATKVFISHLHTDHHGDLDMLWTEGLPFGRTTPLEVYGPSAEYAALGTEKFVQSMLDAEAWDLESRKGKVPTEGAKVITHEFDYNKTQVVYDRDGAKVTSFPAVHAMAGAVSYRLDWKNMSIVYSGDTKPNSFMVENGKGVDLLMHETFLPATVFANKTGMTLAIASNVVNGVHTPPRSAGFIFNLTEPKLPVMFHAFVNDDTVGPVFEDLRVTYHGPVVLAQDLTTFNMKNDYIIVRQAQVENSAWPIIPQDNAHAETEPSHSMPSYLTDAEIKVPGINTELNKQ